MLAHICAHHLRLVAEGVQSIVPTLWQDQRLGVRGQAWGCVSLSDVLLLVEVKYDVVTHKLYTEMLQEHHSKNRLLCTEQSRAASTTYKASNSLTLHIPVFSVFCRSDCLGEPAAMATR